MLWGKGETVMSCAGSWKCNGGILSKSFSQPVSWLRPSFLYISVSILIITTIYALAVRVLVFYRTQILLPMHTRLYLTKLSLLKQHRSFERNLLLLKYQINNTYLLKKLTNPLLCFFLIFVFSSLNSCHISVKQFQILLNNFLQRNPQ